MSQQQQQQQQSSGAAGASGHHHRGGGRGQWRGAGSGMTTLQSPQQQVQQQQQLQQQQSARRCRQEEQRQQRDAQVALDEISEQIRSWSSPMVHEEQHHHQQQQQHHPAYGYEQDAVEWMKQTIEEEDGDVDGDGDFDDNNGSQEDITMMPDDDGHVGARTTATTTRTPKRTLERADTPVMSNARRGSGSGGSVHHPPGGNVDTPMIPHNVQSPQDQPHQQQQPQHVGGDDDGTAVYDDYIMSSAADNAGPAYMQEYDDDDEAHAHAPLSRLYIQQCPAYHDALVHYVKSKRRLVERMDLWRREQALILHQQQQQPVGSSSSSSRSSSIVVIADAKLVDEEHHIEADLLRTLSSLAFDKAAALSQPSSSSSASSSSIARKEGNFWMLLARLRGCELLGGGAGGAVKAGMEMLLWDNDADTERRNLHALTVFKESLASRIHATPLELVQALSNNSSTAAAGQPLILRRRLQILQWLQDCFRRQLPSGASCPRTTNNILSSSELLSTQGLYETDQDAEILRLCLAFVLAGRLDDTKRLVRESGLAWRAAQWSGGAPHGYRFVNANNNNNNNNINNNQENKTSQRGQVTTTNKVAVGNTRRPLWKVLMWKQSESLAKDPKACREEAAIAAILAHNLKKSLDNAALRSWEKGLYVSMRAVLGRLEDEVLHAHNNNRRRRCRGKEIRPPYPGTEFENKEREHLVNTSNITPLTEAGIIQMLASSPFEEMRHDDPVTVATAALLVGKSAVVAFMQTSIELLEKGDESTLRFMAHLALYLDSLSACSTPLNMPEIAEWKNEIVLRWVDHLSSREELWNLVVLYVSLLPERVIIASLPILLSQIESRHQRKVIVAQMQEFLPNPSLDRIVLQEVVRLVLSDQDDHAMISGGRDDDDVDDFDPSDTDDRKMRAILWLCQSPAHLGDALIFSNTLLRHFLLTRHKLKSAFRFIDDIRPQQVLDLANGAVAAGQEDNDVDKSMEEEEQHSPQVQQARWEHVAFQSYLDAEKEVFNWREVLGSSETSVVVEDGIDFSQLNATETAIAKSTERRTVTEIKRERSSIVVSVANEALEGLSRVLHHPGGWLFIEPEDKSDDEQEQNRYQELQRLRVKLLPKVAMLYLEVCSETAAWLSASLDDGVVQLNGKPDAVLLALDNARDGVSSSPMAPTYWTRQALQLVDDITSDTMTVEKACGVGEMKDILRTIADITVAHLKYSSDLGQSADF